MIGSSKKFIIIESLLALILSVLIVLMVIGAGEGKPKRIYAIIPDSENENREALKYGFKTAADEFGVDVIVVSTGEINSLEEEIDIITRELDSDMDGMIVEPVGSPEEISQIKTVVGDTPLVEINLSKEDTNQKSIIGMDNRLIGDSLATEMFHNSFYLNEKSIVILAKNKSRDSNLKRIEGVKDGLAKRDLEAKATIFVDDYLEDTKIITNILKDADIVLSVDDDSSVFVGEYIESETNSKLTCYGVGNSSKALYYLNHGLITSLIVPDEYYMGYCSVKNLVSKNKADDSYSSKSLFRVLKKDSLFQEENEDILTVISR